MLTPKKLNTLISKFKDKKQGFKIEITDKV